jgi:hypothetical protein
MQDYLEDEQNHVGVIAIPGSVRAKVVELNETLQEKKNPLDRLNPGGLSTFAIGRVQIAVRH